MTTSTPRRKLPRGIRQLKSGSYQARVSKGTGQLAEETFATVEEAEAWRAAEKLAWQRSRRSNIKPPGWREAGKQTVAAYWTQWIANNTDLGPGTREMYDSYWRNHIAPVLGRQPLQALENEYLLDQFARGLRETTTVHGRPMAGSTQARILSIVSAMITTAVAERRLSKNPMAFVTARPEVNQPDTRALSREEVEAILAYSATHHGGRYRPVWMTAVYCGLRWGELAGLQVFRVDLTQRRIHVQKQLNRAGNLVDVKDDEGRWVGIPPRLLTVLRPLVEGRDSAEYVFTGTKGQPLDYHNVRARVWDPMVADLGLRAPKPTIHSTRHTTATAMAEGGASPLDVQYVLGHSSQQVLQRYFHPSVAAADRAVQVFADHSDPAPAPTPTAGRRPRPKRKR